MTDGAVNPMQDSPDQHILRVERLERAADGVVTLILTSETGGDLPAWTPGAHIDIVLPIGLTRQYSLCGDPSDRSQWRIGILRVPESRGGSEYIHTRLQAGDKIVVVGPRNNFSLESANQYLFIAGGIGITPILPMLAHLSASNARWRLLYGGRSLRSMAFLDEIRQLTGGVIDVCPEDECGLLDLDAYLPSHEPGQIVYCCGPEPLIAAVENRCRSWPDGTLRRERFAASARPTPFGPGEFEVELARSGKRVRVPADRTLLGVLEDAGCVISNSCRAGICGTCLVNVIAGTPEHLDDILDDRQREAGNVVLPCVSRSRTDTLVLDL